VQRALGLRQRLATTWHPNPIATAAPPTAKSTQPPSNPYNESAIRHPMAIGSSKSAKNFQSLFWRL